MKNEELIKALRHCGEDVVAECNDCPLFGACDSLEYPLLHAADALEAAEKRIAELEEDIIYWQTYAAEIEKGEEQ